MIGVLPDGFRFAGEWPLFLPLRDDDLAAEDRTHRYYHMVGRLRAGVSADAATQELSAILGEILAADPRLSRWSVLVEPMLEVTTEAVQPALWFIAAAAVLVFAVSVVNLGTLQRVRYSFERGRELAVRTALGGTRSRVMATLLIEAAMLCAAGGVLGLLLSPVMLDLLAIVAPAQSSHSAGTPPPRFQSCAPRST